MKIILTEELASAESQHEGIHCPEREAGKRETC